MRKAYAITFLRQKRLLKISLAMSIADFCPDFKTATQWPADIIIRIGCGSPDAWAPQGRMYPDREGA